MANESTPPKTDAATETTTEPAPKYMTAEEFNGAMTARERRSEERQAKAFTAMLEKFWASKSAPSADTTTGDDGGADGGGKDPTAPGRQIQLSEDQLAAKKAMSAVENLKKQLTAEKEAAAKEKAELLQRQERSDMIAALAAAGVTTAKGAYATLKEDGRIRRNADGELVMVVVKDYSGTKAEEEVPIAAGIKEWLGTDDGKCFLPARGGGEGSGTVPRGAPRTGAPLSKEEAKKEAQRMLSAFVLGGGQ